MAYFSRTSVTLALVLCCVSKWSSENVMSKTIKKVVNWVWIENHVEIFFLEHISRRKNCISSSIPINFNLQNWIKTKNPNFSTINNKFRWINFFSKFLFLKDIPFTSIIEFQWHNEIRPIERWYLAVDIRWVNPGRLDNYGRR